jgi:hypothetical protein
MRSICYFMDYAFIFRRYFSSVGLVVSNISDLIDYALGKNVEGSGGALFLSRM